MAAEEDGAAEACSDRRRPREMEDLNREDFEDDVDEVYSTDEHFRKHSINHSFDVVARICDRIENRETVPPDQLVVFSRHVAECTKAVRMNAACVTPEHFAVLIRVVGLLNAKLQHDSETHEAAIQEVQIQLQQQAALLANELLANRGELSDALNEVALLNNSVSQQGATLRDAETAFVNLESKMSTALEELAERDRAAASQLQAVAQASNEAAGKVREVQNAVVECRNAVEQRLNFFDTALQTVHKELSLRASDGMVLRKDLQASFANFVDSKLREIYDSSSRAISEVQSEMTQRLTAVQQELSARAAQLVKAQNEQETRLDRALQSLQGDQAELRDSLAIQDELRVAECARVATNVNKLRADFFAALTKSIRSNADAVSEGLADLHHAQTQQQSAASEALMQEVRAQGVLLQRESVLRARVAQDRAFAQASEFATSVVSKSNHDTDNVLESQSESLRDIRGRVKSQEVDIKRQRSASEEARRRLEHLEQGLEDLESNMEKHLNSSEATIRKAVRETVDAAAGKINRSLDKQYKRLDDAREERIRDLEETVKRYQETMKRQDSRLEKISDMLEKALQHIALTGNDGPAQTKAVPLPAGNDGDHAKCKRKAASASHKAQKKGPVLSSDDDSEEQGSVRDEPDDIKRKVRVSTAKNRKPQHLSSDDDSSEDDSSVDSTGSDPFDFFGGSSSEPDSEDSSSSDDVKISLSQTGEVLSEFFHVNKWLWGTLELSQEFEKLIQAVKVFEPASRAISHLNAAKKWNEKLVRLRRRGKVKKAMKKVPQTEGLGVFTSFCLAYAAAQGWLDEDEVATRVCKIWHKQVTIPYLKYLRRKEKNKEAKCKIQWPTEVDLLEACSDISVQVYKQPKSNPSRGRPEQRGKQSARSRSRSESRSRSRSRSRSVGRKPGGRHKPQDVNDAKGSRSKQASDKKPDKKRNNASKSSQSQGNGEDSS